jgi:hypothetical protein
MGPGVTGAIALGLTLVSGIADAYGFMHASHIWRDGSLVSSELLRAWLGFIAGIATYIVVIRLLDQLGVRSASLQTLGWFVVTIVGVAVLSGDLTRWSRTDQLVGGLTALGASYLLMSARS